MNSMVLHSVVLFSLMFPFSTFAENVNCDAKFLDLAADSPTLGFIRKMSMTDRSITLVTEEEKEISYHIDENSSSLSQRTYIAKTGDLPINQTPVDQQISVMLVKPNDVDQKNSDGVLTDSHLDNYILLNCKTKNQIN